MKCDGWMWLPGWENCDEVEPTIAYFRGRLVINQLPPSLFLKISADSRYKLYVNGQFVEMGPSRGNPDTWYVDTVDIGIYLRPGENVLAVIVLRYPDKHWQGNCGVYRTSTPGLYCSCMEKIVWKCCLDESFSVIRENPWFAPLMIYEQATGNKSLSGWMLAGFDDSRWMETRYYSEKELPEVLKMGNLVPRTIPFLYRKDRKFLCSCGRHKAAVWDAFLMGHESIQISEDTIVSVEIDAGELMTGYLQLRLAGGKDAKITLLQSECYAGEIVNNADPYKSLPQKGNRTDDSLDLYGYRDTYIAAGYGTQKQPETYEPFWFRTFRYIRMTVETKEDPVELLSFDYVETGYPLEVKTKVETSDVSMAGIWDIAERSLRRCMHETYEDCPFYEQLQYAMDTRSQILYTYAVSADPRLGIKAMDDFSHSARPDGMINCSYPNFETNVIPGFSIYYIGMVYDYMMYFGSREQIAKYIPTIEGILAYFEQHLDERGLVEKLGDVNGSEQYWSFIDWALGWDNTTGVPPCTRQGSLTMESLLYILGLQYAVEILEYLDKPQKAIMYRKRIARVQDSVKRYCVGKNGMYQDGPGIECYSQHQQVFAVLTDTVSAEKGRALLEETLRHPEKYEQCSIAMMFYLFRALEKCELYHYTDELWEIWREMLRNNMTTCAEDNIMCRSDCHAWGALALYELPSVILGVRPGKPGYGEIIVSPRTHTLEWAKGTVITPKGEVFVSWQKQEDRTVEITVHGPKNVVITVGKEG